MRGHTLSNSATVVGILMVEGCLRIQDERDSSK